MKKIIRTALLTVILTMIPAVGVFARTYVVNPVDRELKNESDVNVIYAVGTRIETSESVRLPGGYSHTLVYTKGNERDEVGPIDVVGEDVLYYQNIGVHLGASYYLFDGIGTEGRNVTITLRVQTAPAPTEEDKKEEVEEEDHTPVNPDAIGASFFNGGGNLPSSSVKIGKQEQGPAAKLAFKNACPKGWIEAFAMTMSVDDKQNYSRKTGTFRLYIPGPYQKPGRKFAIMALDKYGKVHLLTDTDKLDNVFTAPFDIEGYAFELIYMD
ncbi:MAG: hypothetical protein K6G22_09440 [Lachnospiraceae bacterium]|nr:hypothetical protein [Lachnospiraceae bacterium]